ncbi:exopolysaccharide biosynthesis protein [Hyphomicrobium sp.]|uniref:exopolysaccharide biosynthesis protein n=1 Tax=Hyphomicrobium sp. TaxID=82 RepID=UPI002E35CDA8|nr:exopolysaccharide biosynthesis protein [Hyphomicrobium sp.]HEX2841411.1 exopolysaccharide biosynthesis protein [Hyphomicrobium sp.]
MHPAHCDKQAEQPGSKASLRTLWDDVFRRLPTHRDTTLGELHQMLGDRGAALTIAVISVPAMIPSPGLPVGTVFGLVLLVLAYELQRGRRLGRLPQRVANIRLPTATMLKISDWFSPWCGVADRYLKYRLPFLSTTGSSKALSVVIMLMALMLALPIPFGNFVPAVAVFLIAIGLACRDGAVILAGIALSCAAAFALGGMIFWASRALAG